MFAAFAAAALLLQSSPAARPAPDDMTCAAAVVILSEGLQRQDPPDPEAEASLYALMLYFLGRVEASHPTESAADLILDAAQGLNTATLSQADVMACATFMQSQGERLVQRARARGRDFR